jgi:hypothetical protein
MRLRVAAAILLLTIPAGAGVKINGTDFVPKDLIFAAAEPRSRATAEGPLPNECSWSFTSETRVGRREDDKGCVRYFYDTVVRLAQNCPEPAKPQERTSERITATAPVCPDGSGKVQPPNVEAHVLSSGTTSDGKHQDIVQQPDGTRIVIVSDDASVVVTVLYPDGSGDGLKLP